MPNSSHTQIEVDGIPGYYRYPTIYQNTVVFTAEGDLWKVCRKGGIAQRLTTHPGSESHAAISPDGRTLAFSAQYEGPTEVYTMPLQGGLPTRMTYEGEEAWVVGWTPDGKILYSTKHYSTLPNTQLATIDPATKTHCVFPLSQANDGVFTPDGETLFFTRLPFQGSHTKRYTGGTAQNIWKFTLPQPDQTDQPEALPLTGDYTGTSKAPMWWNHRIYFASDRDGTMNLWSMDEDGQQLQQHTTHKGWDVQSPQLHQGAIVYQLGADLHLFDVTTNSDYLIPITLASDFEHTRERWVKYPMGQFATMHIAPTGEQIVLTSRGRVFVAPAKQGRFVEVTRKQGVRYRQARFLPDGKTLLLLSDEAGEMEFWTTPANGIGHSVQLTDGAKTLYLEGIPSPDGQWLAYHDKNHQLWLLKLADKTVTFVATTQRDPFEEIVWSPDSHWLAYVAYASNDYPQIWLYHLASQTTVAATSDRTDSYSPTWSVDGKWLYFLSNRHFRSVVSTPWGLRQPEPYFDKTTKIYMLAFVKGLRSPFQPHDEIYLAQQTTFKPESKATETLPTNEGQVHNEPEPDRIPSLPLDLEGLAERVQEAPLGPGNYVNLTANGKYLFWLEQEPSNEAGGRLVGLEIRNQNPAPFTLLTGVREYALSLDGKKLLVRKNDTIYIIDALAETPKELEKCAVNLQHWTFSIQPREEWRQMLVDAWRLARDYFYDPNLHGLDWRGLLDKHLQLVDRVTDREELNNLLAQLVGELGALHTYVYAHDVRRGPDWIDLASLGAKLVRAEADEGYRIERIYVTDPDYPERRGPLARPEFSIAEGDILEAINGTSVLAVDHPAILLKNQAGQQVLVRIKAAATQKTTDLIIKPISARRATVLRYEAWQYKNRQWVEAAGQGRIGYVHLRGMEGEHYTEWVRDFYPIHNRQGLIVDVRHNGGGSIDSWILEKLLRKIWFYWQPRVGPAYWNMPYAFPGHMVVLCNELTKSDGEAFAEGFRRLGLGKLIGTRTWGGEIWLSRHHHHLVDRGYATAAQIGVYSPDGEWLIEGHGVEPDMVVDNLPHATFLGRDAQMEAAVRHLQALIQEKPVVIPPTPPYPNKAFRYEELISDE